MHKVYPSHCATCFSQPLLMFCFQKELNVSHLKGFFLNGHRPNDFDHRLKHKQLMPKMFRLNDHTKCLPRD